MNKIIKRINENLEDIMSSLKENKCEQLIPLFKDYTNENIKILNDRKTELNGKYLPQMRALKNESDHDEADWLLCELLEELGYTELVEVYKSYQNDENAELKKQLKLEKAKSSFWKLKANGDHPVILGSKEAMKYITS